MNWGVYQEFDGSGKVVGFHVVPIRTEAGEEFIVDGHELDANCPCGPEVDYEREDKIARYNHHAPNHPGSLERTQ